MSAAANSTESRSAPMGRTLISAAEAAEVAAPISALMPVSVAAEVDTDAALTFKTMLLSLR
ncbi:hypothetical protein GCM10023077_10830 [Mycolicibacterium helvum]